jgi:hypothetical protein
MKTSIVSAQNQISNGFAASYATAVQSVRGFTGNAQDHASTKPMVHSAIIPEVAKASANAEALSNELDSTKLNVVA